MSYYTGTATDYLDLLDIIAAKALLNDWVLVEDKRPTTPQIILKGEADSGTDEIYIGLLAYANDLADLYGFYLQGYTGYQAGVAFHSQQGAIPNISPNFTPTVQLWNTSMPYWLVVNKRRIICVVKISTLYFAFHLGYILPYASVGQYPYPLCIGGSNNVAGRYDAVGDPASVFPITYQNGNLRLREQNGVWQNFSNFSNPNSSNTWLNRKGTFPYAENRISSYVGWKNELKVPNSGGDIFNIQPILIFESSGVNNSKGNIYGQFDGLFHIGGLDNASENTFNIGGNDYMVFQNIYRTSPQDFFAMRLT